MTKDTREPRHFFWFGRQPQGPRRRRSAWASLAFLVVCLGLFAFAFISRSGFIETYFFVGPNGFPTCPSGSRQTCIVDGDTLWLRGHKIKIKGIQVPKVREAQCAAEAELGEKAKRRLIELLSRAPFRVIYNGGANTDEYGNRLRIIESDGRSVGDILIKEGLARRWEGRRLGWC